MTCESTITLPWSPQSKERYALVMNIQLLHTPRETILNIRGRRSWKTLCSVAFPSNSFVCSIKEGCENLEGDDQRKSRGSCPNWQLPRTAVPGQWVHRWWKDQYVLPGTFSTARSEQMKCPHLKNQSTTITWKAPFDIFEVHVTNLQSLCSFKMEPWIQKCSPGRSQLSLAPTTAYNIEPIKLALKTSLSPGLDDIHVTHDEYIWYKTYYASANTNIRQSIQ